MVDYDGYTIDGGNLGDVIISYNSSSQITFSGTGNYSSTVKNLVFSNPYSFGMVVAGTYINIENNKIQDSANGILLNEYSYGTQLMFNILDNITNEAFFDNSGDGNYFFKNTITNAGTVFYRSPNSFVIETELRGNELSCNTTSFSSSWGGSPPTITSAGPSFVSGTINNYYGSSFFIEVYIDAQTCASVDCQGSSFLGSAHVYNSTGDWTIGASLSGGEVLTAMVTQYDDIGFFVEETSTYASCYTYYAPLSSSIEGLDSLTQGQTYTYDGNPGGGDPPYTMHNWSQVGGTGTVLILNNNDGTADLLGDSLGTAILEYIVTDSLGAIDTSSMTITVVDPCVTINASIGGFAEVCIGQTLLFDGNPSGGLEPYSSHDWSQVGGNGNVIITDLGSGVASIKGVGMGSVDLQYILTDNAGCVDTSSYTLNIGAATNITIDDVGIEWQQNLGGESDDVARDIIETTDGGTLIVGSSRSTTGDLSSNYGNYDYWIVKLDSLGVKEWEKNYGGSSYEHAYSAVELDNGGYVIAGYTHSQDIDVSNKYGFTDYWVIAINSLGVLQWEQNYGGTGSDQAKDIIKADDGGYLVLGDSRSNSNDVSNNYGIDDYWLIKIDSLGVLEWEQNYGGTSYDYANSIVKANSGYILAGSTESHDIDVDSNYSITSRSDCWLVKIDSLGAIEWDQNYGSSLDDNLSEIITTIDGGYIFMGDVQYDDFDVSNIYFNKDIWVVKLDSLGVIEWEQNYGSSSNDYGSAIIQLNDESYLFSGTIGSESYDITCAYGNDDYWLVKIDSLGTIEWDKTYGGTSDDISSSLLVSNSSDIYLSGKSESGNGITVGNNGLNDIWVLKLDTSQQQLEVEIIGDTILTLPNHNYVALNNDELCGDYFHKWEILPSSTATGVVISVENENEITLNTDLATNGTLDIQYIITDNSSSVLAKDTLNLNVDLALDYSISNILDEYIEILFTNGLDTANNMISVWSRELGLDPVTLEINASILKLVPIAPFKSGDEITITLSNVKSSNNEIYPTKNFEALIPITNSTTGRFSIDSTGIILPSGALAYSYDLSTADFDKDGLNDIVFRYNLATGSATNILVYLQQNSGSYNLNTYTTPEDDSSLGGTPDLNNDGYPDLVVAHGDSGKIQIRLNDGTGMFGSAQFYDITDFTNYVKMADLDKDGDIDLYGESQNTVLSQNVISILFNNGVGAFGAVDTISVSGDFGGGLDGADLDDDGDVDFVYCSRDTLGAAASLKIFENDGLGGFTLIKDESVTNWISIVDLKDLNNDGQIDLLFEQPNLAMIPGYSILDSISFNNLASISLNNESALVGDVDGDLDLDLFNTTVAAPMIYDGLGFSINTTYTPIDGVGHFLSDMDTDGDLDLIHIDSAGNLNVYINEEYFPYVVNTEDDIDDGICDMNHCSLIEAYNAAENDGINSEIIFDISGPAPYTFTAKFLNYLGTDVLKIDVFSSGLSPGDIILNRYNIDGNFLSFNIADKQLANIEFIGLKLNGSCDYRIRENVLFDQCIFADSMSVGPLSPSINNTISNCTFESTSGHLKVGSNMQIVGNTFEGFGTSGGYYSNLAIEADFGAGVEIRDNKIFNHFLGIELNCRGIKILDNEIYNNRTGIYIWGDENSNNLITENKIENNEYGIDLREGAKGNKIILNEFNSNSVHAIQNRGLNNLYSQNTFTCNTFPINNFFAGNNGISAPVITNVNQNVIGTAEPNTIIEIFVNKDSCDVTVVPQGEDYLTSGVANTNGDWSIPIPSGMEPGQTIVATQTDFQNNSSPYSSNQIVLPNVCALAERLPVNKNPCSTTGIVLDLKQLTDSGEGITSSCSGTYVSNDAWYRVETPSTRNFLVRANLNNTVEPVIEAYVGNCGNFVSAQPCAVLDSVPYVMVFENYDPGVELYLRVWDKDNTITSSSNTALLHLTAHELPELNAEWELCDEENNLANGNPTIISRRDANSEILEYDVTLTAAELASEEAYNISQGLFKLDECLCNSAEVQLWGSNNPIDLDEFRKSARARAKVDTTNYNYIFETLEFQINAYAIGEQYATDVSMDEEGNFSMTWIDKQRRHNYGRVYNSAGNPITQEYQIGSTNATQYEPAIAMQANGNFISVWQEIDESMPGSAFSIYGRKYNSVGSALGAPFSISEAASNNISPSVDTLSKYAYGINPGISVNDAGDFVTVWQVKDSIYAQRFDSSANLLGTIELVSKTSTQNPNPSIAMDAIGNYVITWTGVDSDKNGVYFRRYNSNGSPIGGEVQVNSTTSKNQSSPDVAMIDNGQFVIVWQSFEQEGGGLDYGIFGQRYDANANPVGGEFQINTYVSDAQTDPSVSMLDDGTFMVAWSSYGQDGFAEGIFAQMFDNTGVKIDVEFGVNQLLDPEQITPKTSTNGENILIAAWVDGANDGSFTGIFGQRYEIIDVNGTKQHKPIGTATPSVILGNSLPFNKTAYVATDTVADSRVAVIDTGADITHPYLSSALWVNNQANDGDNCYIGDVNGYDFVNETGIVTDIDGHGTRVSGIITRDFDENINLQLMNLKFHENENGKVFDAICAIYYAVDNGADILNLSWGFEAKQEPKILFDALTYASDNDVLIVTTAGNTSKDNDMISKYPANLDIENMICVTAFKASSTTGDMKIADYASFGQSNVDIAAQGFIETPIPGGGLEVSAGTSLAAPLVARTAATIKGLYPMLSAFDIKDCIMSSAEQVPAFANRVLSGGILDHDAALACAHTKAMGCLAIDLYITIPQSTDTTYLTDAWITSDATINNNSDVTYKAAEYIEMTGDFEVLPGTEFLATIEDCDPNTIPFNLMEEAQQRSLGVKFKIPDHATTVGKVKTSFYANTGEEISIKVFYEVKKEGEKGLKDEWSVSVDEAGWYEKIIDVHSYDQGVYRIEFENSQGDVLTKRIQVQ